jgi:uridine kinase
MVDFDSPDAFDTELLRTVLLDLKASKSVQVSLRSMSVNGS